MNETSKLYDDWIVALRTGHYESGKYLLKSADNKFCCLGVLCDISELGKWHYDVNEQHYSYRVEDEDDYEVLSYALQSEINFFDTDGGFKLDELSPSLQEEIRPYIKTLYTLQDRDVSLSTINDNYGGPKNIFEVIADILDERPPSLFIEESSNE